MQHYILGLCLLATIGLYGSASAFEPIWISPLNVDGGDFPESYDAGKNVWANISTGAGSRGVMPIVAMDSKGILWIIGGSVMRDNSDPHLYNVWNYNPKTDQYRYVWGSSETARSNPKNVGELRVPDPLNHPGKIYYSSSTIDKSDNIWFASSDNDGEFWMFNTTSMLFTRIQGSDPDTVLLSVGANPGQPGEDVWPGFVEAACMVTDSQNNLWLLAGANSNGYTNTVWHFNTTSYLWTFVYGDTTEIAANHNESFYGGTWAPGCFIDQDDQVWLFGGYGRTRDSYANYGSIWTFDTRYSKQWILEWGVDTAQSLPQSVSTEYHPDNRPGSGQGQILIDRLDGATLIMVPTGGNNAAGDLGQLNQVWLYNKTLRQWKLVHGDVNSLDSGLAYVNYRQNGSSYAGTMFPGRINGINLNGDVYIVGGGVGQYVAVPNRNDIWFIPNDQCSALYANKCDPNADCIEEMFGYSCACKQGYTGDGFTCTAPPVAPVAVPVADGPAGSPSTAAPVAATPKKQTSNAAVVVPVVALMALAVVF